MENTGVNFSRDVIERLPPDGLALIELARDGIRREWSFGEVHERSARLAGTLARLGIRRGDVLMTLIGNRPEWVLAMLASFRLGAVVLPCTEQLRAKDLRRRLSVARPSLIIADERNRSELEAALAVDGRGESARDADAVDAGPPNPVDVLLIPDETLFQAEPAPYAELAPQDPALITFTSGSTGEPRAVLHGQRYLVGQRLQAERWLGARPGELVWCTAASGWSKSARNVFIAPWLSGAAALLHDGRFDTAERLELLARERVNVLCMAPTEYRLIAKRHALPELPHLRGMVAAGEALNPEVLRAWAQATSLAIRDGYGQTETGQLTGMPLDGAVRPGSMGRPLPGIRLWIEDGELLADPASVPTFFLGYLSEDARRGEDGDWQIEDRRGRGPWRTGDRVREEGPGEGRSPGEGGGYLHFEGRTDDVIISAGYRIGPFEVESALVAHPAVAEAAAVAAPDEERGSVVRAVVVLRDGHAPSAELARELQEHVKHETAPYKYPRILDFAPQLPKTASGKVMRGVLREEG
ncbi:MAG TPA: AMP-binding protein [Solirubrobacteraceae bacterium]|nr:AMP-binding protein [Solirubrobacteraceae bacterium]